MKSTRSIASLSSIALLVAACGKAPEPVESSSPQPAAAPHAGMGQAAATPNPGGEGGPKSVGSIVFDVPAGWGEGTPSNNMRLAQFRVGDGCEVVLFFFGPGGGGGVEANMGRWIGQFTMPDGSAAADAAERSSDERDGMSFHHLDLTGTWSGGMSGGGGETRFVATIVEAPGGPYFFRLTGSPAEVAERKAEYDALIASLQPQG